MLFLFDVIPIYWVMQSEDFRYQKYKFLTNCVINSTVNIKSEREKKLFSIIIFVQCDGCFCFDFLCICVYLCFWIWRFFSSGFMQKPVCDRKYQRNFLYVLSFIFPNTYNPFTVISYPHIPKLYPNAFRLCFFSSLSGIDVCLYFFHSVLGNIYFMVIALLYIQFSGIRFGSIFFSFVASTHTIYMNHGYCCSMTTICIYIFFFIPFLYECGQNIDLFGIELFLVHFLLATHWVCFFVMHIHVCGWQYSWISH